mgnify:CR=1 FL=1
MYGDFCLASQLSQPFVAQFLQAALFQDLPDSLGGLPTPTYSVAAGQPAPMDTILLAAGSMLPAGTALGQRVAVQAPLMLQPDFFDKGFSYYDVIGQRGVMVSEGAEVNVSMPVLRLTEQAQGLVSGGSSATALQPWIPPLHLDDPDNSRLHQRAGASLALKSGSASSTQADIATNLLHIARGAVINVDPGQSIALQGIGQITVDGTLNAWGGSIELRQGTVSGSADIDSANNEDGRSIWIGETARLDAAARGPYRPRPAAGQGAGLLCHAKAPVRGRHRKLDPTGPKSRTTTPPLRHDGLTSCPAYPVTASSVVRDRHGRERGGRISHSPDWH